MNRRAPYRRAPRQRLAGLLALVAVFWLAQLQGVAHVVSHLGRDHGAPHSLVCGDCIVSTDAVAAPVAAPVPSPLVRGADAPPAAAPAGDPGTRADLPYRSRAPPGTPS